jgi:hypothetical protein
MRPVFPGDRLAVPMERNRTPDPRQAQAWHLGCIQGFFG